MYIGNSNCMRHYQNFPYEDFLCLSSSSPTYLFNNHFILNTLPSLQVIRVKWSLHAREEIIFELLQHLKGSAARNLLEGVKKSTREMIEEQEAVRGRLFTIQDVMQSKVRAWLQVSVLMNLHFRMLCYFLGSMKIDRDTTQHRLGPCNIIKYEMFMCNLKCCVVSNMCQML